ncbi:MAG: hypothetical protein HS115_04135 [Spirochaetales bacterium]|nr:hypothetical protein [Spirochaetales bacterium]
MRNLHKTVQLFVFFLILSLTGCFGVFQTGQEKRSLPAYLLAFFSGSSGGSATASPTTHLSSEPGVSLPGSLSGYTASVTVSEQEAPRNAGLHFQAVGKVYNITLEGVEVPEGEHVYFGEEVALTYKYDAAALKAAGLIEDFVVFYYDAATQGWIPLERSSVDTEAGTVTAYTTHFTPFVLTALPAVTGNPTDPPACIAGDFPAGLDGSGKAKFMTVGSGYQYYQDRNYIIDAGNASFDALGFQGALGISTCNGNSACGTFAEHKFFEGNTYIQFTAHMAMDVYIMYDDRANPVPGHVPDWFNSEGYVFTGHNIGTTDPGANYNVFKKTFTAGQQVTLGGNRLGSSKKVETNYWVVLKPAGVTAAQPPGAMCLASPPGPSPLVVTNLQAAPGSTVVNLRWDLPTAANFAGVVIRRSQVAPPATVNDGEAPGGTVIAPTAYRDEGLVQGASYFYSVFAVDSGQNVGPRQATAASTGPDSDSDGLSDVYEIVHNYLVSFPASPAPYYTDKDVADSDGDGVSDGMEWLLGTDPTGGDGIRPVVTRFETVALPAPNYNPQVPLIAEATDNIGVTGWLVTESALPPLSTDPRWDSNVPVQYELTTAGDNSLYLWVRDEAGNVSLPYAPIVVHLDGISVVEKVYVPGYANTPGPWPNLLTGETLNPHISIVENPLQLAPNINVLQYSILPHQLFSPATLEEHLIVWNANTTCCFFGGPSSWDPRNISNLTITEGQIGQTVELNLNTLTHALRMSRDRKYLWSVDGAPQQEKIKYYRITENNSLELLSEIPISQFSSGAFDPQNMVVGPDNSTLLVAVLSADENFYIKLLRFSGGQIIETASQPLMDLNLLSPTSMSFSISGNLVYIFDVIQNDILGPYTGTRIHRYKVTPDNLFEFVDSTTIPAIILDGEFNGIYFLGHIFQNGTSLAQFNADSTFSLKSTVSLFGHYSVSTLGHMFLVHFENENPKLTRIEVGASGLQIKETNSLPGDWASRPEIRERHETNLPPQVQMGDERWLHFQSGQPVSLNAHGYAWDPDAGACNANSADYQIAWEIVSAPGGSAVTTGSIASAGSLNGASFIPDVPGEYTVRLNFTDHPGSCQGSPQGASGQVKLKIGYEHKTKDWCYEDKNSVAHGPTATWHETDWWHKLPWYLNQYMTKSNYPKRHFYSSPVTDPESWKCSWLGVSDPNIYCTDDHGMMLVGDWRAFLAAERANGTPRSGVPFGQPEYVPISCGFWHWWDYSP